jgi:hypothetical protein
MWRMASTRSRSTIRSASGRSSSAMTITPATRSSTATTTCASPDPRAVASVADARSASRIPTERMNARLPTATRWPSTVPWIPWPGSSRTSSGMVNSSPASAAAATSASPRTWADRRSSDAASPSSSAEPNSACVTVSRSSCVPTVNVPVLSNSTSGLRRASRSRVGRRDRHRRSRLRRGGGQWTSKGSWPQHPTRG